MASRPSRAGRPDTRDRILAAHGPLTFTELANRHLGGSVTLYGVHTAIAKLRDAGLVRERTEQRGAWRARTVIAPTAAPLDLAADWSGLTVRCRGRLRPPPACDCGSWEGWRCHSRPTAAGAIR